MKYFARADLLPVNCGEILYFNWSVLTRKSNILLISFLFVVIFDNKKK